MFLESTRGHSRPKCLLLLSATTGYQVRSFRDAAEQLGVEVILGTDRCHVLEDPWRDGAFPLRFERAKESARRIARFARREDFHGIVALGDRPTVAAAHACQALGLPGHSPEAAEICRNKHLCRLRLRAAGFSVPRFRRFLLDARPPRVLRTVAREIGFPCVLKPLALSGSRGVIRADDGQQFLNALDRLRTLLLLPEVQVMRESTNRFFQVEEYIEGKEVAVEGLVRHGRMKLLAIFDKPEPLAGPYFEETIYVTPTELSRRLREQLAKDMAKAVSALGLAHGPFHAEWRLNSQALWPLEIAARPIGGLCARALRFRRAGSTETISLEELLVRLALDESVERFEREPVASGVMMIPVEKEGIFIRAEGLAAARQTPGIEDIVITAKPAERLVPWPEGSSYPGFIFARGPSPGFVRDALDQAHRLLRLKVASALPVMR